MRKRIACFLSLLLCAVLVIGMGRSANADATVARVELIPSGLPEGRCGVPNVSVMVSDVVDLYGYELYIEFDPTLMRVVDADGNPSNGTQVQLGSWLQPDFVVLNRVDQATGLISVSVTQLNPHLPVSGSGELFTIQFAPLASGGSMIHFVEARCILANRDGERIPASYENLYIESTPCLLFLPCLRRP